MDNASKALIMAGAVLIAVLLVSLGVLLLQSMDPMIENQQQKLERDEVVSYNSKYTMYEGTNRPASQASALINLVNQNNHDTRLTDIYGEVDLSCPDRISNTKKYDITVTGHDARGVITAITIEEH